MATATHEFDGPVHRTPARAVGVGSDHEGATPSSMVLGLQRTAGNAATTRFVHRVAEASAVQRACDCGGGACATCGAGAEAAEVTEVAEAG